MDVNYSALIEKYEDLKKYWRNGKYEIINNEAVVLLNRCILLHYLDLVLPKELVKPGNLFPRIPGRAWYVQFAHDNLLQNTDSTTLLDVGTGAYAIYAIIAARIFKSKVKLILGTDIDRDAVKNARKLVQINGLAQIIDIRQIESPGDNMFEDLRNVSHAITMCNPPFYSSPEEMQQQCTRKVESKLLLELEGTSNELFTQGGEVEFVKKMFRDSVAHCHQKIWFTCMISKFSSLKPLNDYLECLQIKDHYVQDYTLGQTTRWVILWNFRNWKFNTTRISYKLRKLQSFFPTVLSIGHKLRKSLTEIEILLNQETSGKLHTILESPEELFVIAEFDCWSRAYRRRKVPKESDTHIFRLCFKQSLHIIWSQGSNSALFQSFHGFVNSLYLL